MTKNTERVAQNLAKKELWKPSGSFLIFVSHDNTGLPKDLQARIGRKLVVFPIQKRSHRLRPHS